MTARSGLVLTLVAALQLLAWREVVPVCASMAHCGGATQLRTHCEPPATIDGTADCCKGGSATAPAVVSPMPQRTESVTPAIAAVALVVMPPSPAIGAPRARATADASPPLPPLLSTCILRI